MGSDQTSQAQLSRTVQPKRNVVSLFGVDRIEHQHVRKSERKVSTSLAPRRFQLSGHPTGATGRGAKSELYYEGSLATDHRSRGQQATRGRSAASRKRKGKFRTQERGSSDENTNEIQASIAAVDPLRRRRCYFSGRMCRGALYDCV